MPSLPPISSVAGTRIFFGALTLLAGAMLATALLLEYVFELAPCSLCLLQRGALLLALAPLAAATAHGPGRLGGLIYASGAGLAAIAGGALAGYHLRLQHLPAEQLPECGPGLDYLLQTLPPFEALTRALTASGECGEVAGRFLGLSIPAWTLIGFALLVLPCAGYCLRRPRALFSEPQQ